MLQAYSKPLPKPDPLPKPPVMEYPDLETPGGSTNSSPVSSSNSQSKSVPQNISAQVSFDPGKRMNRNQITSLAQSVGFSPEASNIVYAISGGESGFDPTNSTRRSVLDASTGKIVLV